jgi:hypothetical protein
VSGSRKLQVFVSSTFEDMQVERSAAVNAVLGSGHIPAGMELFSAGDETQLETIYRWIEDSDVYLLILGGRYGTIEPKSKKGYTELEYLHAVRLGKPFFALVIDDDALDAKVREHGRKVDEKENNVALKDFRGLVLSKTSSFYSDSKDIQLSIMQSLNELSRSDKLIGWMRADSINSVEVLEENRRLRQQVSALEGSSPTSGDLMDLPPIPAMEDEVTLRLFMTPSGYGNPTPELEFRVSWLNIFPIFFRSAKFDYHDWNNEFSFAIDEVETSKEIAISILIELQGYAVPRLILHNGDVQKLFAYYVEANWVIDGFGDEAFSSTGKSVARRMTLASRSFADLITVVQGKLPVSDEIPF